MRSLRFVYRPWLAAWVVLGIALSSCSGGNDLGLPECEDGRDNDGDNLIDELDPSCIAGNDRESMDPTKLCADGLDNDGDTLIDTADPGCTGPTDDDEYNAGPPACSDDRDNDGDGKIDYPYDPGCLNGNQDSETDDCPSGPNCPQCGDGVDNDRDMRTDYPNDTGCVNAADDKEFILDTSACGPGTMISVLPPPTTAGTQTMVMGTAGSGVSNLSSTTCQGRGQETVYVIEVDQAVTMVASTDNSTTNYNTTLYVREACRDQATEIACNDDISATNTKSKLTVDLEPGVYFLVVDARDLASSGNFSLAVNFYRGPGEDCTGAMECAPGYVCRAVAPATQMTCEHPVCSDGRDDDSDGDTDFPNDPGCTSDTDGDETDDCPAGPNCPDCGDATDNDLDGDTDYPADIGCRSASGTTELDCSTETDPLIVVNTPTYMGTTVGAMNNQRPTCGSTTTFTAPDRVHALSLSVPVQTLTVTIAPSFDSAISFVDSTCTTSLQCADPNTLTRTAVAPGNYNIVVDGWSSGSGTYSLTVRGDLTAGAACNDPLVAAGVLVCPTGFACQGTAGMETCQPAACNDTIDADADGFPGFPTDPGCTSVSDGDETDTCPAGPGCPACSDDLDNDMDGATDYPMDPGCTSASGTVELDCSVETDPLILVTGPTFSGTTVGATDNVDGTCGSSSATAPDRVHYLTLRVPVASLTVTTTPGFDAITSLTNATCGTTIQCQDFSPINATNLTPGSYGIIVDGWSTGNGTYSLDIRGTLTAGGACNDPLVAAGVLSCPAGLACAGPMGMETCRPAACNDAIDADGDGAPGFPGDPGCTSSSDNDEVDDCPSGPGCPQCGNDVDDDGDLLVDFPNDLGCLSAADVTEVGCGTEVDNLIPVTAPVYMGTTAGAGDNLDGTCGSTTATAPDRVHYLSLGVPVASLTVTTTPSFDAVTSFMNGTCSTTAQCQDSAPITVTNLTPGSYGIAIDGWSSGNGNYTLEVRGTLAGNGSCEDPLVAAGVLACPVGFSCGGTPGMQTCQPAACNDAVDADADGFPGFPTDPGCTSPSDGDESDNCPSGPGCPQCSDGLDNDTDTTIDYPMDTACVSAADTTELGCGAEADDVVIVTGPTSTGTTVGAANNFTPTCQTSSLGDRVHLLTLPVPVATLRLDTEMSTLTDSVLMVMNSACGSPPLACDDDSGTTPGFSSLINMTNVPAGTYGVVVDTYGFATPAPYLLHITGTVIAGTPCTDPLFAAGLLSCAAGTTCQAGFCAP